MATKLYLGNDDAPFAPATLRGAWDKTAGAASAKRMGPRFLGVGSGATNTDTNATNNYDVLITRFVSDPLAGSQTISGTVDLTALMRESDAAANDFLHWHIFITAGDTDTVRGTILTDRIGSTELAVSATLYAGITDASVALSSQAITAGDRIVIEVGYQAQNTVTTSYTGGFKFGGDGPDAAGSDTGLALSADNAPFVSFSQDLVFLPKYLYYQNAASPIGAVPAWVLAWDDTTQADAAIALGTSPSGVATFATATEVDTSGNWRVANIQMVSPQLAAQTIAGTVTLIDTLNESNIAADFFGLYQIYLADSAGNWKANLLNIQNGTEASTSNQGKGITGTMTSQSAANGDRIVVECGYLSTNISATSRQGLTYYGGTAHDVPESGGNVQSGGVSWIRFNSGLDLNYVPGGGARSQAVVST